MRVAKPNIHNRVGESAAFSEANASVRSYYFAKTPTKWPFDHLSSASVVMDSSGALITNQRFMPFGELREGVGTRITDPAAAGFTGFGGVCKANSEANASVRSITGQSESPGFGLMDYHARFY